ncbi:MAG: hypothetical protein K2M93_01385, partial [Muribaculaceae bacterium]|nr:hypothetical protein [Muribaculaceae bacterium]
FNTMKLHKVNIDKLEQSFVYDEEVIKDITSKENNGIIRISENVVLVQSTIERNFKFCYKVNLETEEETITLGYLYWGSNNKWLNCIYFKVFNKRLYDNTNVKVNEIGDLLGLKIKRSPNIEIAVDFNFNVVDKIYELFKRENLEVIILNRLIKKDEYVPELLNNGKGTLINPYKFKGFYIRGRDKHRLELNAYDKTMEIKESSHKEYIMEAEGFEHIYRLEVRVNGVQLYKTLKALGISRVEFISRIYEPEVQFKVWENIFDRLLRFRTSGKRECERILDLLMADDVMVKREPANGAKHPLKRLIRHIIKSA